MGASAAGGILNYQAALEEGQAKAGMYRYQAGVSEANRRIQLENADYARKAGEKEALRYGMAARHRMGEITVAQGASGVDIERGSHARTREGQQLVTAMDLEQIRENAGRRAYGHEVAAFSEGEQARMYEMSAQGAQKGSKMKAMASLISGASSVSSKWYDAKRTGVF